MIVGAFLLLLSVIFVLRPLRPPEVTLIVKVVPIDAVRRVDIPPIDFDSESYYHPILAYNLFRPLGWTPPRRVEPYRLLGTRMGRDANTPPQAILQTTSGNRQVIVSIGDILDASTEVVSIAGKSVVLETAGKKRTLRLETGVWLNPSRATRSTFRRQATVRPPSVRNPRVASPVSRSSSRPPSDPSRARPLSEWQTREGEPIRLGDARLKNPAKWELRRR